MHVKTGFASPARLWAALPVVALALSASAAQGPVRPAPSASPPPRPTARADAPLGISTNADLSFGQAITGPGAGTIAVTPAGARSASGGVTLGSGLAVSTASFTVTGQPYTAYGVVLPGSILLSSGRESIRVDGFTSSPRDTGSLDGAGSQALNVGATLHVPSNQAGGSYSGAFSITVGYN